MPAKVLLVDDDPGLRKLVRLTLGPDYEIIEATDGAEAVEIVRREHPDVVFMDVRMPRVNGFEACRQIKSDPESRATKVVMLTAHAREDDRDKGEDCGADDYITKPYSPLALLRRVEQLLKS